MIGQTISHSGIAEKVGAAGVGRVHRAEGTNFDRQVAIQALPGMFGGDPERLERFEWEAGPLAFPHQTNSTAACALAQVDRNRFRVAVSVRSATTRKTARPLINRGGLGS